jgi:excisionase family DNA binding protein
MADVFRRERGGRPVGSWTVCLKDAAGRWRNVTLKEARTKAEAQRLADDLALRFRRQRDGLEPLPPPDSLTVAALLADWHAKGLATLPSAKMAAGRLRAHFAPSLLAALPVARLTPERIEAFLQERTAAGLSPATVNHLRGDLRTSWNWAVSVGLLSGLNPTARVKTRRVPERAPSFLEVEEVCRLLTELQGVDRLMVATLLLSAVRKGELFGLRKSDVDLKRRLLMLRRSYDHDTTKGKRARAVPICTALVPILQAALDSQPGELLFPKPDGTMRAEQDGLIRRMRTALCRPGLVSRYIHSCRRCKARGTLHRELHTDGAQRSCPSCGMKLWATALPKELRLHDTRHTTATLLLGAGADLWGVAKMLGHSDPSITASVYGHLMPGYLAGQADRLSGLFDTPAAPPTQAGQGAPGGVSAVSIVARHPRRGFECSTLLHTSTPTGPEGLGPQVVHRPPGAPLRPLFGSEETKALQGLDLERATRFELATFSLGIETARSPTTTHPDQKGLVSPVSPDTVRPLRPIQPVSPAESPPVHCTLTAPLKQGGELRKGRGSGGKAFPPSDRKEGGSPRYLKPSEVAELLGVCRALVYRWVSRGELPAVRIGSLVRVLDDDLARFASGRKSARGHAG